MFFAADQTRFHRSLSFMSVSGQVHSGGLCSSLGKKLSSFLKWKIYEMELPHFSLLPHHFAVMR